MKTTILSIAAAAAITLGTAGAATAGTPAANAGIFEGASAIKRFEDVRYSAKTVPAKALPGRSGRNYIVTPTSRPRAGVIGSSDRKKKVGITKPTIRPRVAAPTSRPKRPITPSLKGGKGGLIAPMY